MSRFDPKDVPAVIRGHQHSSVPDALMRRLIASQGLFRHWQETDASADRPTAGVPLARGLETTPLRALPEHSVWTLNVAPDSVYGAGVTLTSRLSASCA